MSDNVVMPFADTHAHLDGYEAELDAVLDRAHAAGVQRVVAVGINVRTSGFVLDLWRRANGRGPDARPWPQLALALGLHPHYASRASREAGRLGELLRAAQASGAPVAVGETGLDYYRDRSPRIDQRRSFWQHIEWAHELNLPLVVHDRDAHDDVLQVLRDASPLPAGGVMHCYSGDAAMAEACVELGMHISFAGPITFPNGARQRQLAARLPLDRVLVETDCPYMAPVPHRGKTNEPAYVVHTGRVLAAARAESDQEVLGALWNNATALFWRTGPHSV